MKIDKIVHENTNKAEAGGFLFWTDKKVELIGNTDINCDEEANKLDQRCVDSFPIKIRLRISEVINLEGIARFDTYNYTDPASNPPWEENDIVKLAGDNSIYVDE